MGNRTSFGEASRDSTKRNAWLRQIEVPPYVTLEALTPQIHAEISAKFGYSIPLEATATTYPLDKTKVWRGATSRVLVHPICFEYGFETWAIMQETTIRYHELEHAQHYHDGLPGFDEAEFITDGALDTTAFNVASELLAHANEYREIQQRAERFRSDPTPPAALICEYVDNFGVMVRPYASMLPRLQIEKETRRKLEDAVANIPNALPPKKRFWFF